MAYGELIDRSAGNGDCFIVTGSIGPSFQPRIFRSKKKARAFAREILAHGKAHNTWPPYKVVIEDRFESDMRLRSIIE